MLVQTQSHGHTHAQTSRHTYAQVKTVEVKKLSGSTYNEGLSLVNLKSLGVLNADVLVIKVSLSLSFAGTRAHTQALSLSLSVSLLRSLSPPHQFPRVCVRVYARVHVIVQKFLEEDGKVCEDTDAKVVTACKMIALLRKQVSLASVVLN